MRRAAFTVIPKPFDNREILRLVAGGLRRRRKDEERRTLKQALKRSTEQREIIARSEKMLEILAFVEQVAPARTTEQRESIARSENMLKLLPFDGRAARARTPVLGRGEPAPEKELTPRAIH